MVAYFPPYLAARGLKLAAIAWLVAATSLVSTAALPLVEAITLNALAGQAGRYGPIRLWGSIGFMAAVVAGGAWLDAHDVALLPYALFIFAAATLGASFTLPASTAHVAPPATRLRVSRSAACLLASGLCMAVAHGTLYAFFTLHLQRLGYSASLIGFLWMLSVLAEIGVFFYLPVLFRRYALSTLLVARAARSARSPRAGHGRRQGHRSPSVCPRPLPWRASFLPIPLNVQGCKLS